MAQEPDKSLQATYRCVRDCIVAFGPKYHRRVNPSDPLPLFPPIIGTGVFVGDGLVATNDHVIAAFDGLHRPPGVPAEEIVAVAHILRVLPFGVFHFVAQIDGAFRVTTFAPGGPYYGPKKPDVGLVVLKIQGTPYLELDLEPGVLSEGVEVATAGFPMGVAPLIAPGYIHQLSPTLQRGVIGAVLPFPSDGAHAFMLNVMTQGGASGSPVFRVDTPKVLGLVYAGLNDISELDVNGGSVAYRMPTNYSYAVPARLLKLTLDACEKEVSLIRSRDWPRLDQLIEEAAKDPERHVATETPWRQLPAASEKERGLIAAIPEPPQLRTVKLNNESKA